MKTCAKCGEEKADREYYVSHASRDGLTKRCRSCIDAYDRERAEAKGDLVDPVRVREFDDPIDARKVSRRVRRQVAVAPPSEDDVKALLRSLAEGEGPIKVRRR